MRTTHALVMASLLAAACGGDDGKHQFNLGPNAAEGATFSYGAQADLDAYTSSSLTANVQGAATPTSDSPVDVGQLDQVTTTLIGGSPLAAAAEAPEAGALARAAASARARLLQARSSAATFPSGFENPACVQPSGTKSVYRGCTAHGTSSGGMAETLTVDGWVDRTGAGAVAWDLSIRVDGTGQGVIVAVLERTTGSVGVTGGHLAGSMGMQLAAWGQGDGRTISAHFDQSLTADVTFTAGPTCVTGGALEAKRVWVELPPPGTTASTADVAAKVTFTGCGTGTIARGSQHA